MVLRRAWLVCLTMFPSWLQADMCRLESEDEVEIARDAIRDVDMVVTVCGHCRDTEPVPLRIREIEFKHFAPESVSVPFYDATFTVDSLEEAENTNSGPMADMLRARIEEEYANDTGYLPNDPYLLREKRARFKMILDMAREQYEMRVWDELLINGEAVDPARIYYPVGNGQYRSLGRDVDCDMPRNMADRVTYEPVARDPATAAPPEPYIADVTSQCYDGSCPADAWTVVTATPYFDGPGGEEQGVMESGEVVHPLQTLSYVVGAKATATRDHDHIFEGDTFYLLDSQAEGYYRIWHYGRVFIADASDVRIRDAWNYCLKQDTCWGQADSRPNATWWSKVRRQGGEIVWLREPIETVRGVLVD